MKPKSPNNHEGNADKWIDKQDIMMQMNISDRTLYNWRRNKILPFTRIGGKIYYRESDLKAVLEKNTQR